MKDQSNIFRLWFIGFCCCFPENRAQSQLPYKKWPLFSNFQVQRDSPSATKNGYLLCLYRRYIIHFQYSVSGFGILELTKSRE